MLDDLAVPESDSKDERQRVLARRAFLQLLAGGFGAVLAGTGKELAAQGQAAALPAGFETTGVTAEEVKIGMSAAFKGAIAGLGVDYYRGSQAFYEEVNSKGGIAGRKIRVVPLDDSYDPALALNNTVRLLEQEKVFELSNYVGTPTLTRALPLLRRFRDHGVLLVGDLTGAQPQREPPYADQVFNIRASYRQEMAATVGELWKLGPRKFGVFYQIDAYGRSGWDGVTRALAARGAEITAEATYKRGATFKESMAFQVNHLRSAGVEAVVCTAAYQAAAAFVRDVRADGWNVPISNLSFVGSDAMLALLLEEGRQKGKDLTRNLVNSEVVPGYSRTDLPGVLEYTQLVDKWRPAVPPALQDPNLKPTQYSANSLEGFINAKVVVEALRRAGANLTRSAFRAALESMTSFDAGIGAPISFSPSNHQGLDRVYFTQVVGGRWVPLTDWRSVMAA